MSGITQTDTVRIPLATSVKIIQDLGRLDEARVKIVLLEENERNYKALIASYEKSNQQYKEMMQNAAMITDLCRADLKDIQKKYKAQVRKFRLVVFGFAAMTGAAIYGFIN